MISREDCLEFCAGIVGVKSLTWRWPTNSRDPKKCSCKVPLLFSLHIKETFNFQTGLQIKGREQDGSWSAFIPCP